MITHRLRTDAPVIILLGWMGGSSKHLSKYSDYYRNKGYNIVIFPCKLSSLFKTPNGDLLKLVDTLTEMGCIRRVDEKPRNSAVVHLFSNGGACNLWHLTKYLQTKHGLHLSVSHMIIDSAPGDGNYSEVVSSFKGVVQNKHVEQLVPLASFITLSYWKLLAYQILGTLLEKKLYNCPRLILYSKADTVIHYKSIENFIERSRTMGFVIESIRWGDSDHVRHLLQNPQEYKECIDRFLSKYSSIPKEQSKAELAKIAA